MYYVYSIHTHIYIYIYYRFIYIYIHMCIWVCVKVEYSIFQWLFWVSLFSDKPIYISAHNWTLYIYVGQYTCEDIKINSHMYIYMRSHAYKHQCTHINIHEYTRQISFVYMHQSIYKCMHRPIHNNAIYTDTHWFTEVRKHTHTHTQCICMCKLSWSRGTPWTPIQAPWSFWCLPRCGTLYPHHRGPQI